MSLLNPAGCCSCLETFPTMGLGQLLCSELDFYHHLEPGFI